MTTEGSTSPPERPTELLVRWRGGDDKAFGRLVALLQHELLHIARAHYRRERIGHSLEPTVLVNEAFLRLIGQNRISISNRSHFLAMASRVMRQILIDHARRRRATKHGGLAVRTELGDQAGAERDPLDAIAIDVALSRLESLDARQAQIVELKCFAGLQIEEIAQVLAISPATVKREWTTARMWLRRELQSP